MASNRNALTCGAEISFCGDRILVIAQVVADVGQRLDQGDTEIGNMRFLPVRNQKSESVENQLPEAIVVFSQIIDVGLDANFRRTDCRRFAIQVAGATRFELEGEGIEKRIKTGHRLIRGMALGIGGNDTQHVIGKIARAFDRDVGCVVKAGVRGMELLNYFCDADVPDPLSTLHDKVSSNQTLGRPAQKRNMQSFLVGADFDEIESIAVFRIAHVLAARVVFAGNWR